MDGRPNLFISYSLVDSAFVRDVGQGTPLFRRVLERLNGGDCTVFASDRLESDEWKPEVLDRIDRADVFVPVISEDYLYGPGCRLEVDHALKRRAEGKKVHILPFLYRYCLYREVAWLYNARVWKRPDCFYMNEPNEHEREKSIIGFRSSIERILARSGR